LYAAANDMYGWGWTLLYVTDRYADGYPRRWTIIPAASCEPRFNDQGRREYKVGERLLDPANVVQIDRNPTSGAAHGTSAIHAYAQVVWGLLAAQNQSTTVTTGGTPKFYLKSERKLTAEQALDLQTQWMARTADRNGAPPVLPPEITPTEMSFNPSDLALLDNQEWSARIAATAYGVPSVVLNMALVGGLTYQNPIALMQMWWLTELRNKAKRFADAFNAQMLPRGQWVDLDASDITVEALNEESASDDPQLAEPPATANASPAQTGSLAAIGGGRV
jgi:phage portal protein BeeE